MRIELTKKQLRRLLDLVYIGNWILNSARGDDRIRDYDEIESTLFALAAEKLSPGLAELSEGEVIASKAFVEGGIHEAIMDYEDTVFFEILAEELARRDMELDGENEDPDRLRARIDEYISEFEIHGTDNLTVTP